MPVLTRAQPFDDLQAAINQESYRFLDDHAPELIEGIEAAIARGKTPEEIAAFRQAQGQRRPGGDCAALRAGGGARRGATGGDVSISGNAIELEAWVFLLLNLAGGILLGVAIGPLVNERRRR